MFSFNFYRCQRVRDTVVCNRVDTRGQKLHNHLNLSQQIRTIKWKSSISHNVIVILVLCVPFDQSQGHCLNLATPWRICGSLMENSNGDRTQNIRRRRRQRRQQQQKFSHIGAAERISNRQSSACLPVCVCVFAPMGALPFTHTHICTERATCMHWLCPSRRQVWARAIN